MRVVPLLHLALLAIGILNLALLFRLSRRLRRQARTHAVLVERLLHKRRSRLPSVGASPDRFR